MRFKSEISKLNNFRMRLLTLFIASLVSAHGDLKAAIGKPAPDFTAEAVVNGDFQKVLSKYKLGFRCSFLGFII